MSIDVASLTRRAMGLAFATTLLAGAVASAATPVGEKFDADFEFRDALNTTAVLAVYPYSDGASPLGYLKVKGPQVSAVHSYPTPHGSVGWRVIIESADSKSGPWTIESKTKIRYISANKVGKLERFKNRLVNVGDVDGTFVRVTSRLIWFAEDGGTLGWVKHTYTRYGLVESSGIAPSFGDESATRTGAAPATWTH